ncbi:MAG: helix-turn-helix transcriptional regulator [Oscillospiraceae bacterium]|nr:helix-turn-helix transcriptional regulator [Candidatus Ruminococcus equi]
MTRKALSITAKLPYSNLAGYETGRLSNPTADFLKKVSKTLDVSIDWLLGMNENDVNITKKEYKRLIRHEKTLYNIRCIAEKDRLVVGAFSKEISNNIRSLLDDVEDKE